MSGSFRKAIDLIRNKNTSRLQQLISQPGFNPSHQQNRLLIFAVTCNNLEAVKLLLADKRVDPVNPRNSGALRIAAKNGFSDIVKILLDDGRSDPASLQNYAIKIASENGFANTVKLLLQDKRVDPSAENDYSLRMATANGHIRCVDLLTSHKDVDLTIGQKIVGPENVVLRQKSTATPIRNFNDSWRSKNIKPNKTNNFSIDLSQLLIKHVSDIKRFEYTEKDGKSILVIEM
uniref:Uncharacterized protein n=1 Tax=viral metagenome TaxID=1070528 RepID=A0A6C0C5D5_9ZZZZ